MIITRIDLVPQGSAVDHRTGAAGVEPGEQVVEPPMPASIRRYHHVESESILFG